MVGEHLTQRRVVVHDQVGAAAGLEPVAGYAEHVGRRRGDRVVDEVEPRLVEGAERVRGEERDLEHVCRPNG